MMLDMTYFIYVLPGMILAMIASWMVKSTFNKYSQVGAASGLTGAEAAHQMLESQGIHDVRIEQVQGFLSDHYDPTANVLRLSPQVYGSHSLSAIGVACHEAGHALQKAHAYAFLGLRSKLVPVCTLSSNLAMPILMAGFFMQFGPLINVGIALFSAAVLFSIVTLPVEWDASARAKKLMVSSGIVSPLEQASASRVLNAAFLTYLASAITAILTLVYYLTIANRRNH